ncbi:hypothetical protein MUK42_25148 [Musa troglodytarum]|uniref:Uncharacterized protein n=1 Tax=Musa troglodytarum TaxID=320322 RepID=A0A9E7I9F4_9LILI|nr:hypothetical protein MUK42_25148 [Musa troglodytarum]
MKMTIECLDFFVKMEQAQWSFLNYMPWYCCCSDEEKFEPEHGEEDTALHHHFCYSIGYSCVPSRKRRNPTSLSICSTTESQFLSLPPLGDGLVLHLGLTLIWPAHVTLGDVGSAISELMLLLLVLKRGLTWPRVPDLAWWRFPASAVREGLHIGFGINVRCARDGKQTRSIMLQARTS